MRARVRARVGRETRTAHLRMHGEPSLPSGKDVPVTHQTELLSNLGLAIGAYIREVLDPHGEARDQNELVLTRDVRERLPAERLALLDLRVGE